MEKPNDCPDCHKTHDKTGGIHDKKVEPNVCYHCKRNHKKHINESNKRYNTEVLVQRYNADRLLKKDEKDMKLRNDQQRIVGDHQRYYQPPMNQNNPIYNQSAIGNNRTLSKKHADEITRRLQKAKTDADALPLKKEKKPKKQKAVAGSADSPPQRIKRDQPMGDRRRQKQRANPNKGVRR